MGKIDWDALEDLFRAAADPENQIWDEECGYCDDIMNVCNHPLQPDKYAHCKQQDCPILHPEIIKLT